MTEKKTAKKDDNVIFVGKKAPMNYVLAVITQFNKGEKEVIIAARGRSISTAVDTAQIVKNKFMPDIKTKDITISTEEVTGDDGNKLNVSSMSIILAK